MSTTVCILSMYMLQIHELIPVHLFPFNFQKLFWVFHARYSASHLNQFWRLVLWYVLLLSVLRSPFSYLIRGSFLFLQHSIFHETVYEYISFQNNRQLPKITTRGAKMKVVILENHIWNHPQKSTHWVEKTVQWMFQLIAPLLIYARPFIISLHFHSYLVNPSGESLCLLKLTLSLRYTACARIPSCWLQSQAFCEVQHTHRYVKYHPVKARTPLLCSGLLHCFTPA